MCNACGKAFCSTTSTPYSRIQYSRNLFDEVCLLSVEGVNKSIIARIKHLSWNTVSRWIEHACIAAKRFNRFNLNGFSLLEPQADEIRTFVGSKKQPIWIITLIEVWSRLWPSCIVGKRNYKNIRKLFRDTIGKSDYVTTPLITTDHTVLYNGEIGGGIYCYESSPTIINNIIIENRSEIGGGIVCCGENSMAEIRNCHIAENEASILNIASTGAGGGIACIYSNTKITNNVIVNNKCGINGGGVWAISNYYGQCKPLIQNNIIQENISLSLGGGMVEAFIVRMV